MKACEQEPRRRARCITRLIALPALGIALTAAAAGTPPATSPGTAAPAPTPAASAAPAPTAPASASPASTLAQAAPVTASATGELQPFSASYSWRWHGFTVAVSHLQLLHRPDGTWVYRSNTEPRGLARLLPQRPRNQSIMRISADGVQPLSYHSDDGTSSRARFSNVVFDWRKQRATGVYDGVKIDLPLHPGVEDDLSVQIALMRKLLSGQAPDKFYMIDKGVVNEYLYSQVGRQTLSTPLGHIATIIYRSQKPHSPYSTRFWCAPSLGFLPMRVQQKRLDEVKWTMNILTLKRQPSARASAPPAAPAAPPASAPTPASAPATSGSGS